MTMTCMAPHKIEVDNRQFKYFKLRWKKFSMLAVSCHEKYAEEEGMGRQSIKFNSLSATEVLKPCLKREYAKFGEVTT